MSISSDFKPLVFSGNVSVGETEAPPAKTGTEVWEEGSDTQSPSGQPSVNKESGVNSTIPILKPPGLLESSNIGEANKNVPLGEVNGAQYVSPKTQMGIIQNGMKDLQAMEVSGQKLADFLPKNSPEQLTIKEFIATIRSAIDQLKKMMADKEKADQMASSKATEGQVDASKTKEWTINEGVKARQEARSKLDQMGKAQGDAKGGAIAILSVGSVLLAVAVLMPWLMPLFLVPLVAIVGIALIVVAAVELAPGDAQGYMEREQVTKLKGEKTVLDESIAGTGDGAPPPSKMLGAIPSLKTGPNENFDEKAILEMINILTQMLAKLMMGSSLGQVDLQELQKALSGVKASTVPEELKQRFADIEQKVGPLCNGTSGPSVPMKGDFNQAITALSLYHFCMDKNDKEGAKKALGSLEQALVNIAADAEKEGIAKQFRDSLKESLAGNPGKPHSVEHNPA